MKWVLIWTLNANSEGRITVASSILPMEFITICFY